MCLLNEADTVAYHLSVKAISEIYFSVGEKPIYANSNLMHWMISQILIVLYDTEEILNSDSDEENKLLFLTKMDQITQRTLPEDAIGSLYFYYKNVALAPVNVWTGISQYLFNVEPEFVDSKHFHAATLKRGSARLTERIRKALEACDDEPPSSVSLKSIHEDLYRDMFHGGINILSLFSGINDAEVAFYCLGILLKTNVQELNDDRLEQLMSRFVEFDLVVGSIPCNNLNGSTKHHQDRLEDFCCNLVKNIMDIILTRKIIGMEEASMMHQDLNQYHGITKVQVVTCSWFYDVILMVGENNLSGDAYRPQHEINDNLS
ncbi:hypothetical protein F3Y22_tig00110622pilonHSYRG00033 [Hibiscus syriacus]|uniref:SAM-dependent MTase DRM-type domain-containing protein n=1 Tax=Hibiscus syriacus TaxID=106335 RepID=A0A6A2ZZT7_HIBSY|nr:hypothetical protein F3Y22_tig00110622pilonHSYRG00033 [Hibiscus syriacus]